MTHTFELLGEDRPAWNNFFAAMREEAWQAYSGNKKNLIDPVTKLTLELKGRYNAVLYLTSGVQKYSHIEFSSEEDLIRFVLEWS